MAINDNAIGLALIDINEYAHQEVGNPMKMLKKRFLSFSLNLRRDTSQRKNLIRRLPRRKIPLDFV